MNFFSPPSLTPSGTLGDAVKHKPPSSLLPRAERESHKPDGGWVGVRGQPFPPSWWMMGGFLGPTSPAIPCILGGQFFGQQAPKYHSGLTGVRPPSSQLGGGMTQGLFFKSNNFNFLKHLRRFFLRPFENLKFSKASIFQG